MPLPKPKKILVVSQHYWPEAFRINDITDFLTNDEGCEVDVLCGIPNYPKGQFFDGYGFFKNRKQRHGLVNVRRVFETARNNNSNLRIFVNYISFPIASLFHIPRLLTRKYDKIFLFQTSPVMMSLAGIIVGKLKRTETTMYVLDLWPENLFSVLDIKNKFLRSLVTKISHWHYRHVDKLIVLSEKMRDQIAAITNVGEEKIIVMPQVCEKVYETDVHDAALAKRFAKGFNVFFAGNISPAQSFETVIEAARLLKQDGIKDINWVIVGDGMSRKWLEEEVSKANLSDQFFFEGMKPIEDIPKYTPLADVLLACLVKSPLLEATIPAKVMSYFAAGRPIVLAMDGEVQKMVNDVIKCGFAGETGNAKVLAANIRKIYDLPPKERQEMGKRGRDYHFKHFERNMTMEKLYDFMFS